MQFVESENFLADHFLNDDVNSNTIFPYESSEDSYQQQPYYQNNQNDFELFPEQHQEEEKYLEQQCQMSNQVKLEMSFDNQLNNNKIENDGILNDNLSFTEGNDFNDLASTQEFYYSDQNIENNSKQKYVSDVYQNQSFQLKREYDNSQELQQQQKLKSQQSFSLEQDQFNYYVKKQDNNKQVYKQQNELDYLNSYRKQLEIEEQIRQKEIQKRREQNQPVSAIKLFDLSFLQQQQIKQDQQFQLQNQQQSLSNINQLRNDINIQQQVCSSTSISQQCNQQSSSQLSSQLNLSQNNNITKKIKRVKLNHKNQIASAETKNVPATVGNVLLNKLKEKLPENQEIQKTQKVKNILDLKKLFTMSKEIQQLCLKFLQSGPMMSYVSSSTRIKQKRLVIKYLDVIIQGCLDPANFGCFKNTSI